LAAPDATAREAIAHGDMTLPNHGRLPQAEGWHMAACFAGSGRETLPSAAAAF